MINSKQRAKLRAIANSIQPTVMIGKSGLTPQVLDQIREDIFAHEIVKLKLLETSPIVAKEAAQMSAERTKSDVVLVIGNKFVLYKKNHKKKEGII